MKTLSIGEILWDVIDGAEHLGGAPFNLAAHSVRLGAEAYLLSAVGDDERGRRACQQAVALGVNTRYIGTSRQAETGVATVSNDDDRLPVFKIVRPSAYDFLTPDDELLADSFDAICYGTLLNTFEPARRATVRVLTTFQKSIRFYDVNLRKGQYNMQLVRDLMAYANILKLNEDEAAVISGMDAPVLREFCETQTRLFDLEAIAVTRGERGCAVLIRGEYAEAPAVTVKVVDTVGAGDAFGAAFLHGVCKSWPAMETAQFANRVGALVATRAGATPMWSPEDLEAFA